MTNKDDQFYSVGRVKDAQGLKGELYIKLRSKQADWLEALNKLHLATSEHGDELKTFELTKARPHKDGLVVGVKEVTNRTEAESLKGFYMLIPVSMLQTQDEKNFYLYEVKDFEVFDEKLDLVGKIVDFATNGAQDLIVVKGAYGLVEIPLIDEFIKKVAFAEKTIHMNLPPGLVEKDEV